MEGKITVSMKYFGEEFARKTHTSAVALQLTAEQMNKGTFKSPTSMPGSVTIGLPFATSEELSEEVNKTYCHLVRLLIDLIDLRLAMDELFLGVIDIPLTVNTVYPKNLEDYLILKFREHTHLVGTRKINNPEKLAKIKGVSKETIMAIDNYIKLRNIIEHRKGVSNETIDLRFDTVIPAMFIDGVPVEKAIVAVQGGQSISHGHRLVPRTIKPLEKVIFSVEEVVYLTYTLNTIVAEELLTQPE